MNLQDTYTVRIGGKEYTFRDDSPVNLKYQEICIYRNGEITGMDLDSKIYFTLLSEAFDNNDYAYYKYLFEEYKSHILYIKRILKYIGLNNIYYVTREIIEAEVSDYDLKNIIYS